MPPRRFGVQKNDNRNGLVNPEAGGLEKVVGAAELVRADARVPPRADTCWRREAGEVRALICSRGDTAAFRRPQPGGDQERVSRDGMLPREIRG